MAVDKVTNNSDFITWMGVFAIAYILITVSHNTAIKKIEFKNLPELKILDPVENLLNMTFKKQELKPNIISAKICDNKPDKIGDCEMSIIRNHNNIWVYWEMFMGVGCCSTFECSYSDFQRACLSDGFQIYNIYLDGKKKYIDVNDFDYTCEERVPWNFQMFENIALGNHTIRIEQKECTGQIVDEEYLDFELQQVEGVYMLFRK